MQTLEERYCESERSDIRRQCNVCDYVLCGLKCQPLEPRKRRIRWSCHALRHEVRPSVLKAATGRCIGRRGTDKGEFLTPVSPEEGHRFLATSPSGGLTRSLFSYHLVENPHYKDKRAHVSSVSSVGAEAGGFRCAAIH